MKSCLTCGMPLVNKEDFPGCDENGDFCIHCVNEDGSLKTCEEIFDGGVQFFMETVGDDRSLAERLTRKNMRQLPYWQDNFCAALEGEEATEEEFQFALAKLE